MLQVMLISWSSGVNSPDEEGRTSLYRALEENRTDTAESLLRSGANPSARVDSCGSSLLQTAVRRHQGYVLRQLALMGANKYSVDCSNMTVMHEAIANDDEYMVLELVYADFDVNRFFENAEPVVFPAVIDEHYKICKILVKYGAIMDPLYNDITPLYKAVSLNKMKLVEFLLSNGANLNFTYINGDMYLHKAVRERDLLALEYFLSKGLSVDSMNGEKETSLALAVNYNREGMINVLLHHGANKNMKFAQGNSYVHLAIIKGSNNALVTLLENNLPVNVTNSDDLTPTILAVEKDNAEGLKFLIHFRADLHQTFGPKNDSLLNVAVLRNSMHALRTLLEAKLSTEKSNSDGATPASLAVETDSAPALRLLISSGADLKRTYGRTNDSLLHIAVAKNSTVCLQLLLDHKLPVDLKNSAGMSPILVAVRNNNLWAVNKLLQNGAAVRQNVSGHTLLHEAARLGFSNIVKRLIDDKADVNAKDNTGQTPLHFAAAEGQTDTATVLIGNGAKVNEKDSHGNTPLALALANKHIDTAKLIELHGGLIKLV